MQQVKVCPSEQKGNGTHSPRNLQNQSQATVGAKADIAFASWGRCLLWAALQRCWVLPVSSAGEGTDLCWGLASPLKSLTVLQGWLRDDALLKPLKTQKVSFLTLKWFNSYWSNPLPLITNMFYYVLCYRQELISGTGGYLLVFGCWHLDV